jgi:hypothetical protein
VEKALSRIGPKEQALNYGVTPGVLARMKLGAASAVNCFNISIVCISFFPMGRNPSVTTDITITYAHR